jgi:hypothetical protein
MSTLSVTRPARKPRPKPARSIRLKQLPADGHSGVIKITVGKATTGYYLDLLPSDFGRAFRLTKFVTQQEPDGENAYDVLLDTDTGRHQCGCKGFCRYQTCKHTAGLLAIANRLPSLAQASRHAPESVAPTCELCGEALTEELGQRVDRGCRRVLRSGLSEASPVHGQDVGGVAIRTANGRTSRSGRSLFLPHADEVSWEPPTFCPPYTPPRARHGHPRTTRRYRGAVRGGVGVGDPELSRQPADGGTHPVLGAGIERRARGADAVAPPAACPPPA